MSEIKVVMMDLDNTLLDRTEGAYRTFRHFVASVLDIDPDTMYGEAIVQELQNWDGYGNVRKSFLVENLKRHFQIDLEGFDMPSWWFDNLWRFEELYPDALETLDYLKEKYSLALLTNGDHYCQSQKVVQNKLEDYFELTIISDDIGKPKPDPLMYNLALEHFGIRPEEAVYVGDTFGKDILGAYNAGIRGIWIWPDDGRHTTCEVERIYKISDLMNIL